MKVTKDEIANRLLAYLRHQSSIEDLVDWAENALMEGELDKHGHDDIRDALARLGLADVRNFGLAWEDCENILHRLGYEARIEIQRV